MRDISEADWKTFKRLRERALERFSQRILDESQSICSDPSTSAHARYVQLYQLLQQRDRELASAFDDLRRSTAALCFRQMRHLGLVTDEELTELSPQFQARIEW